MDSRCDKAKIHTYRGKPVKLRCFGRKEPDSNFCFIHQEEEKNVPAKEAE